MGPTNATEAAPADAAQRPTYDELVQRLAVADNTERRLKAMLREGDERWQGVSDAEGIFGHPSLLTGREKNIYHVLRAIDSLDRMTHWTHPLLPDGPEAGFLAAQEGAIVKIAALFQSLAVFERENPIVVRDLHRLTSMWLNEPFVGKMLRPDHQGFSERQKLKKAFLGIVYGPTVPEVYRRSRETPVEPISAERKELRR